MTASEKPSKEEVQSRLREIKHRVLSSRRFRPELFLLPEWPSRLRVVYGGKWLVLNEDGTVADEPLPPELPDTPEKARWKRFQYVDPASRPSKDEVVAFLTKWLEDMARFVGTVECTHLPDWPVRYGLDYKGWPILLADGTVEDHPMGPTATDTESN